MGDGGQYLLAAGKTPEIASEHYLTVTEDHLEMAAAADTESQDDIWGQTGTQPPATPQPTLQRKSQFVLNTLENTCFSDIVGILENFLVT